MFQLKQRFSLIFIQFTWEKISSIRFQIKLFSTEWTAPILLQEYLWSQALKIHLKQAQLFFVKYARRVAIMLSNDGIGLITAIKMIKFHKPLLPCNWIHPLKVNEFLTQVLLHILLMIQVIYLLWNLMMVPILLWWEMYGIAYHSYWSSSCFCTGFSSLI